MEYIVTLVMTGMTLLTLVAWAYLWHTRRQFAAFSERLDVAQREMDEMCSALDRRIDEVVEEMRERIEAANRRIDETIEIQRFIEDLTDINDRVQCLRTPGGMSKRVRRTDHRQ